MSRDMVYEDVPRLSRRVGDSVLGGSNNSTILLGRDRIDTVDSGYGSQKSDGGGKGCGAMHLIVGRGGENPSIDSDAATVYLSTKTDVDSSSKGVAGILMRADCIRLTPRNDFKVTVRSDYALLDGSQVVIASNSISLGENAPNAAILGTPYRSAQITLDASLAAMSTALAAALTAIAALPTSIPAAGPIAAAAVAAVNLSAAVAAFESGAAAYISKVVRLV